MQENDRQFILDQQMRQTVFTALVAAALMLLFGYNAWRGGLQGTSDSQIYNLSVAAFVWTLLVGGFGMLGSAILCMFRWRHALLVDAVLAGGAGALFIAIGGVQLAHEGVRNITAALLVIFGVLFLRSAHVSWGTYFELVRAPEGTSSDRPRDRSSDSGVPSTGDAPAEEHLPASSAADRQEALQRLLAHKRHEAAPESRPAAPAPSPAVRPEEPAPEGFLADLGRSDFDERK